MNTERYLLFFTIALIIGVALSWGKHTVWLVILIMLLLIGSHYLNRSSTVLYGTVIFLGCLSGFCIGSWQLADLPMAEQDPGLVVFRVESQRGQRYIARMIQAETHDVSGYKVLLQTREPLAVGNLYRGHIRFESFAIQRIPNGFCEKTFYYSQGVYFKGQLSQITQAAKTDRYGRLLQFRLALLEKNERLYTDPAAGFIRAILFGDRSLIGDALTDSFRSLGLAHLLAVSGLHAGIIAAIMYKIFTPGGFYFRNTAAVSVLAFYAFLAGFSPSVNRAALMFALAVFGKIQLRHIDPFTIMAISALVQIFNNPFVIFSIGFQLSYTTLLAIIIVSRQYPLQDQEMSPWKTYLLAGLRTSAAATFGSAPVVIFYFNTLPLSGLLINVVYIPVFSGITFLAMAGLPLSWFFADLAAPLYSVIDSVCKICLRITIILADILKDFEWVMSSPSLAGIILFYLLAAAWIFHIPCKRKLTIIVLIMICISVPLGKTWEMVVIDVGQGDAIYINTRNKQVILVDGGPWGREVEAFLKSRGVKRPDLYILTHAHADHINGLFWLIERKPPRMLMVPAGCKHPAQAELIRLAAQKGVRVSEVYAGQQFTIDGMECRVLSPPKGHTYANVNNQSVIIQVTYRGNTLLLTGDAEREVLDRLQAEPVIDILKAPHHGSNTGASPAFFSGHTIHTTVIPVGENNRYRHPGQEFLAVLEQYQVESYRTDLHGSVSFYITKNGRINIKKMIE